MSRPIVELPVLTLVAPVGVGVMTAAAPAPGAAAYGFEPLAEPPHPLATSASATAAAARIPILPFLRCALEFSMGGSLDLRERVRIGGVPESSPQRHAVACARRGAPFPAVSERCAPRSVRSFS